MQSSHDLHARNPRRNHTQMWHRDPRAGAPQKPEGRESHRNHDGLTVRAVANDSNWHERCGCKVMERKRFRVQEPSMGRPAIGVTSGHEVALFCDGHDTL